MFTDINSEDRLVQETIADYLHERLGWESFFAWNDETFGPAGMLGRDSPSDAVLRRDLRAALLRLNPTLPESAREDAFGKLTQVDYSRSLLQHNRDFYRHIRDGVPVTWRDASGEIQHGHARVIDFRNGSTNGVPNNHPFRVAIVCAMWLTGFDVECLSTLYIDKPMKAHTLMQAIARANRVYPGKDCGVIVDYNGMLKSLRQALAQYALGDDDGGPEPGDIVAPIEEPVAALAQALDAAEGHLRGLGFDPARLHGAGGFERIAALRDAVDAVYTSDESKRRFEIMAREIFSRFKALLMEPSAFIYAQRHDNIETIYKKLEERRDTADVTHVLKELHRIVNEAIRAAGPGEDHAEGLTVDLSQIDFERLRKEFAKVPRKNSALQDIRDLVENKLARMLRTNPLLMDYYKRYQEIVADYNREKDRATVEQTFAALVALAAGLDQEQRRTVEEGLTEQELALFDLLAREDLSKADRERLKQARKSLLARLQQLLASIDHWTRKAQTQAEVEASILDWLFEVLPRPPFTDTDTEKLARRVYEHVWQQSEAGNFAGVV